MNLDRKKKAALILAEVIFGVAFAYALFSYGLESFGPAATLAEPVDVPATHPDTAAEPQAKPKMGYALLRATAQADTSTESFDSKVEWLGWAETCPEDVPAVGLGGVLDSFDLANGGEDARVEFDRTFCIPLPETVVPAGCVSAESRPLFDLTDNESEPVGQGSGCLAVYQGEGYAYAVATAAGMSVLPADIAPANCPQEQDCSDYVQLSEEERPAATAKLHIYRGTVLQSAFTVLLAYPAEEGTPRSLMAVPLQAEK